MPYGYHTFGDWRYMPKLNLQNEDCAQYFLSVGRYWLEKCHVDGWRLDVSRRCGRISGGSSKP